jgi:integrase
MDPDRVFADAKRRALTPEEAGQLLARFPLFWWDHVLCLLGTGLRFGEFAGLRLRRVHLDRPIPVLQVVDTRYQAGRFGSGFKPRPKSDAGIREIPLAPLVVEAIRRQLPPEPDADDLVFTGPGGGNGVPLGHGRSCRATAFAASTRPPPIGPAPTSRTCSSADFMISGTASRPGWRTTGSRRG